SGEVIERSDLLVPLTASSWLDVLGASISLRGSSLRDGSLRASPLHGGLFGGAFGGAPPVGHGGGPQRRRPQPPGGGVGRDAAPLFDGSRIGLVAELADGQHAFVVATRDGEVQRTLACPGDVVRLVPARSQVAIVDRERIALVDLISGRTAAEWPVRSPV